MKPIIVLIPLSVALLAGCRSGTDYVTPEVPVPGQWRSGDGAPAPATAAAVPAWRDHFRDPVLQGLITEAIGNNKDLRMAVARVQAAAAASRLQDADHLPSLSGQAAAGRGRSGITGATSDSWSQGGFLNYEVDLWGRVSRANEAAQARLLAADEARNTVVVALVGQVAETYLRLRTLDRQLEIARSTLKANEASYQITVDKFANGKGVASKLDVAQASTQVFNTKSTLAGLEQSIVLAENALCMLLGRNPGPVARGRDVQYAHLPDALPAGLPSDLLLRRPDIRAAERQLAAAHADIGVARAAYFPRISLTGALGLQSVELDNLFDQRSRMWNYGVQASGPIFDGGRTAAGVSIAEARRDELLAAYESSVQQAFREVDDALSGVARMRQRLASDEAGVAAYQEVLALSDQRFRAGVSDYSDVLMAQQGLFASQLQAVQTRNDLLAYQVRLYKALGGGWSPEAAAHGP